MESMKLESLRNKLKSQDQPKFNRAMKKDDLSCGCGFMDDFDCFKRRGNKSICPTCGSSDLTDYFGLYFNKEEAVKKGRKNIL